MLIDAENKSGIVSSVHAGRYEFVFDLQNCERGTAICLEIVRCPQLGWFNRISSYRKNRFRFVSIIWASLLMCFGVEKD